jgi:indole-3-glycerol phosphate synthase
MDRLRQILAHKETEIEKLLPRAEHLRAAALQRNDFRRFAAALDQGEGRLGLIAEVKKASPSAGSIVESFDPVAIACEYEMAGANAVSVLSDEKFFQGSLAYVTRVRQEIKLPVLRKDFTLHKAQIWEAVCAGADAILLIVAALDQDRLEMLYEEALTFQLDVLVEVHSMLELERAVDLGAKLIGINNRNLTTFEVNLDTTERLSEEVPEYATLVSESGIRNRQDTQRLVECGTDAILVGESLMRSSDKAALVQELVGRA